MIGNEMRSNIFSSLFHELCINEWNMPGSFTYISQMPWCSTVYDGKWQCLQISQIQVAWTELKLDNNSKKNKGKGKPHKAAFVASILNPQYYYEVSSCKGQSNKGQIRDKRNNRQALHTLSASCCLFVLLWKSTLKFESKQKIILTSIATKWQILELSQSKMLCAGGQN